eukprot:9667281-Alexandrium_andersonii.AAC.1
MALALRSSSPGTANVCLRVLQSLECLFWLIRRPCAPPLATMAAPASHRGLRDSCTALHSHGGA